MTQDMKHNDMKRNNEMRATVFTTRRHHGSCGQLLRMLLLLMVMMTAGSATVWGQTVSSGLYYIASGGNNGTVGNFVYNSNSPETNFYLCPTENWRYFKSESPYYQESPDNGMPFMTTYQCLNDNNYDSKNALWCIKKKENTDYYYIIHLVDGKYLTRNTKIGHSCNAGRMRIHLESSPADDEDALFTITYVETFDCYDIKTIKSDGTSGDDAIRQYLNVSGGNKDSKQGASGKSDGPKINGTGSQINVGGIIGLWTYGAYYASNQSKNDQNSRWCPKSTLLTAPTINYDSEANTFTISYDQIPVGFDILYTTDNSDPTIGGSTTTTVSAPAGGSTDAITVTGSYNVKAVIARYGVILTETASRFVGTPDAPTITPLSDCNNLVEMDAGGAPIYYTLDGNTPDNTSTLYTEPFVQNTAATIKAIVCVDDASSDVTTFLYTPTYSVKPTITINGYDVTITGEGTIYYTLDGNDPTTGSSVYSTPISLSSANDAVTIKAVAKDGDKELSCVAEQTFVPAVPGYYAIHQNGKGYLRVNSANVTLTNDGNFRYADLFSNDGNSIWYVTPTGYLQNGYFYLNVINGRTLCLSVEPETRWQTEEIAGDTHDKMHLKTGGLYLCNDNNTITLSASPTAYYNACPITITEKSWSEPSASELTLQSPQQVTYLRAYYTQKMDYEFYNDAGDKVSETDKDRRVYAKLYYESGGDNKGTNWDINTTSGVIYNKLTSNVAVTATYRIEPADPIAYGLHSTPGTKSIKYTLQPKSITPVAEMNYLLFSIKAGNDDRYPYDDGIAEGGDVKPDGKGGTGTSSLLTDPANPLISWKLTVDEEGFYTFQNAKTNKYLYYDETPHASSDYGALKLGSSPSDNRYKFRLYKTSNTDYGTCYQIIPYSKQFVVYQYNGVADGIYAALNNNDYTGQSPKVISIFKANGNSTWCIYKYEAEYRIKKDFSIKVETSATANATGAYLFSSEGWYAKCIKESPKTGNGQNGLVINGTYKNKNNINYQWTVTGIGDYITISDGNNTAGTNSNGTWTITTTGNDNNKKLKITVTTLPLSTVSGIVKLRLSGGESPNVITSGNADEKSVGFTILGDGTLTLTEITSLTAIDNIGGAYKLTQDVTYSSTNKPTVSTFSGILDCDGHTISGLTAPLFETMTNGTVRNVNLSGVNISGNSGPTGAIAGTANGGSRIYNVGILDGSVGSSDDVCGGLVGQLDGSARVINCFSYANITSGTTVGGIVGNNNYASKSNDIRTMVMNCMFYGNISASNPSPIYGGQNIHNKRAADNDTGLNNYCYFLYDEEKNPYVKSIANDNYHGALGSEERYLNRFEFFRMTLNSTRSMAAFYVFDDVTQKDKMAKWVLDKSIAPYPILKDPGYYPSIVNPDAANATDINSSDESDRNKGRKLGTLSVTIGGVGGGEQFGAPSDASISTSSLTLNVTDKDFDNYNFNFKKIQLPYYNEVGTGNYSIASATDQTSRVVTGWKITAISGGTEGTFTNSGTDAPAYNFVDRKCTNKDLYSQSGRVFNQGAYWEVPDGVTAITIEPYWAKAVYLSDARYDVTYSGNTKYGVTVAGSCPTIVNNQTVHTSVADALTALSSNTAHTVYDYAVVLVGNYHQSADNAIANDGKPLTFMSADLDGDREPDNTLFYYHNARRSVSPIRFDFLNMPGIGMTKRTWDGSTDPEPGIFKPQGWFEITNTVFVRFGQFEYAESGGNYPKSSSAPLILQGGIYEQFVSAMQSNSTNTTYIHIGGNSWFKNFANGCHTSAFRKTPKVPINVTGGDYTNFYLTGIYQPNGAEDAGNAACYIDGGRFVEVAGAGMQVVNGDVTWFINGADITSFYGGGINAAQPITGNITTTISNSYVTEFYGGPKFGDMNENKTVTTTANDCHFGKFFGAGYGGTAFNKVIPSATYDSSTSGNTRDWGKWITDQYKRAYDAGNKGISTSYDYEFILHSDGNQTVARFYVNYASLSLASTHNVTSILNGCTIGTFFGGGRLGAVKGDTNSTLTDCHVTGNAFGAGFSAEVPTVEVWNIANLDPVPTYNRRANVFNNASVKFPNEQNPKQSEIYTWSDSHGSNSSPFTDTADGKHYIYTDVTLSGLGAVKGNATITLNGSTEVDGNVFGGGDSSPVEGSATVNIEYDE